MISIVIPNFNGKHLLAKNIPVLYDNVKKTKHSFEVILVDNGSVDGSVESVRTNFPSFKIIENKTNLGFATAVNMGVKRAKGELVVLLNNDVAPQDGFLNAVSHFSDQKVFAVSFNEQQFGPAKAEFSDGFFHHQPYETKKDLAPSFWASGGSAIFRKDLFMHIGGFDEKLFSPFYWEDIDLCYRATKRGYMVYWDRNSRVTHQHESTVKKLNKKYVENVKQRNELLFTWKNITSRALFRKHLLALFARTVSHPGYLKIVILALSKLGAVIKARSRERNESTVSDEVIFSRFSNL